MFSRSLFTRAGSIANTALKLTLGFVVLALASASAQVPTLSIAKSFTPSAIIINGTSTLTFTISSNVAVTNISFGDPFPGGVQVAAVPNVVTTCIAGTVATGATAGSAGVSVTIPSLAANSSCTVSVDVTGTTAGAKTNTSGAIIATLATGGPITGNTASATLAVVTPPTLTKAFGTAVLQVGNQTTLTFTLTNPAANPVTFTNLGFTDVLPPGLAVSTPSGLNAGCGASSAGAGGITLSSVTLAPGASCTLSVNVTATGAGVQNNVSSVVTDAQGVFGAAATATVTTVNPPTIIKGFADSTIEFMFSGTTLSFTISNPNTTALTGIAVADALPAGLTIATPSGGSVGTCTGATLTAPAGGNTITFSGLTLAGGTSCTFSVQVLGTAIGTFLNTSLPVTAFGGTVVGNTATARITVEPLFFFWFFHESGGGSLVQ